MGRAATAVVLAAATFSTGCEASGGGRTDAVPPTTRSIAVAFDGLAVDMTREPELSDPSDETRLVVYTGLLTNRPPERRFFLAWFYDESVADDYAIPAASPRPIVGEPIVVHERRFIVFLPGDTPAATQTTVREVVRRLAESDSER